MVLFVLIDFYLKNSTSFIIMHFQCKGRFFLLVDFWDFFSDLGSGEGGKKSKKAKKAPKMIS